MASTGNTILVGENLVHAWEVLSYDVAKYIASSALALLSSCSFRLEAKLSYNNKALIKDIRLPPEHSSEAQQKAKFNRC